MKITLNLLPNDNKQRLLFKRRCHFMLKVAGIASVAAVVYISFVFACIETTEFQRKAMLRDNENISSNQIYRQIKSDQEVIKEYNKMAGIIEKGISQQTSNIDLLEKINKIVPDGIEFEQLTIAGTKITLKGIGAQRQQVIDFKDQIEKSGLFSKIESPISNLTQEKDVSFQFNLELKTK